MVQMNLTAGTIATRHAQGRCATVGVNAEVLDRRCLPEHMGSLQVCECGVGLTQRVCLVCGAKLGVNVRADVAGEGAHVGIMGGTRRWWSRHTRDDDLRRQGPNRCAPIASVGRA